MAIAVGYRRRETQGFGVPFETRGRRTDAFIEIVRALWAGETVTHESEFFSIKDTAIMPPPLKGHIPLYIGGFSQYTARCAGQVSNGYEGFVLSNGEQLAGAPGAPV